ncbi:hypothetical protein [Curtobacterium sp. PhB25]|uniref:hypothetical protein n=1 Tax=Curtobacterium sp. PhB25 TaxID=2485205 RepID=UPI001FBBBD63|nr:hypothetical protein [Curtobacterium sp. PhB25]
MTQKPATNSALSATSPGVVSEPPPRASTTVPSAGADTPAANTTASPRRSFRASTAVASAWVADSVRPAATACPSSMTLTRNYMATPLLGGRRLLRDRPVP